MKRVCRSKRQRHRRARVHRLGGVSALVTSAEFTQAVEGHVTVGAGGCAVLVDVAAARSVSPFSSTLSMLLRMAFMACSRYKFSTGTIAVFHQFGAEADPQRQLFGV